MAKFLTPNEPAEAGSFYILLTLPHSVEFRQHLKGALYPLSQTEYWQEFGDMSPEDAAEIWSTIMATVRDMPMHEIGTFVHSIRTVAPANWIECKFGAKQMADWPELMEVYPTAWKNNPSAGQFYVPEMRGRVLAGYGETVMDRSYPMLQQGGLHDVFLSVNQLPAHTHGESIAVPAIINGGLEAPASAAVPGAGVTGTAGGGQSHENMPPYLVVRTYIVGRLFP